MPFILQDWHGRSYEVEIAFVRFLGGYVVWVDDDPYDDEVQGEVFPSRRAALRAIRQYFR